MNVTSKLENLLGLSRQNSSAGSFLQLKSHVRFQHDEERNDFMWPLSSYWIIGRELLLYHRLDLSAIPRKQRTKVIFQKIGQLSPFEQTGHYQIEDEGQVMLWLWDKTLQESARSSALTEYSALAGHIQSLEPVPESVLQPRGSEGVVSLGCLNGEDIQEWRDGILISSRWSSASGSASGRYLDRPWSDVSGALSYAAEPLLWRSSLLLLTLVVFYQLGMMTGYFFRNSNMADRLLETRDTVATLAQIRGEVRQLKSQNEQILQWTGKPDQLAVLAEFDSLIPSSAVISEWDFRKHSLSVQIEDQELDNRDYLERLATSALFSNAGVSPGGDLQSAIIELEVEHP